MTDREEVSTAPTDKATTPLSQKVLLALSIALAPIGLLAAALSISSYSDARDASIATIEFRAAALASEVDDALAGDGVILRALGHPQLRPLGDQACGPALDRIVDLEPLFSSIANVDRNGRIVCQSAEGPQVTAEQAQRAGTALRDRPDQPTEIFFDDVRENVIYAVRGNDAERAERFLVASVRVSDLAGETDGGRPSARCEALGAGACNSDRMNITSPQAVDAETGRYAVRAPTRIGGLTVRYEEPLTSFPPRRIAGIVAPPLMWLAALLIAWWTLRRLVIRPLTTMQAEIEKQIRSGEVSALAQQVGDTAEFATFAESYDTLSAAQREDRNTREAALEKQQRLVREVHHRVKNNLQIITSLLSIRARDTDSVDEERAYGTIQMRVEALALVHRWLYADDLQRGVDLGALFNDLLAGLEGSIENVTGVACISRHPSSARSSDRMQPCPSPSSSPRSWRAKRQRWSPAGSWKQQSALRRRSAAMASSNSSAID